MNHLQKYLSTSLVATTALLGGAASALAQVPLGAASNFAILGGTAVTCTNGVVTGDIGVAPGSAYTNTGCMIAGAVPSATNSAAKQAHVDFLDAYRALETSSCTQILSDLANQNLKPGVYCVDSVAKAGTLTLTGPSSGVWTFKVDGALTGTNFSVLMAGGAKACNVSWAPTAGVTMTDSAFKGNILAGNAADGAITMTRGTLTGRALANVGMTMTGTTVVGCATLSGATTPTDPKHPKNQSIFPFGSTN
jgi:hypothetical protein